MITKFNIFENFDMDFESKDPAYATHKLIHLIIDDIDEAWANNRDNRFWTYGNEKFDKISIKRVEELLKYGADINAHDEKNNYGSLLNMAIFRNDFDLVKYLVENGANINDTNACGSTPIYCASADFSFEILEYLVEKGADINIPNDAGVLPLHNSIHECDFKKAIFLLNSGSEIETQFSNIPRYLNKKDYKFQKLLCEKFPNQISKLIPEKYRHEKILDEFGYLFDVDKYNL